MKKVIEPKPRKPPEKKLDLVTKSGCIVAKTKSGHTWLCPKCGDGGISWKGDAEEKAVKHECKGEERLL